MCAGSGMPQGASAGGKVFQIRSQSREVDLWTLAGLDELVGKHHPCLLEKVGNESVGDLSYATPRGAQQCRLGIAERDDAMAALNLGPGTYVQGWLLENCC